MDSVQNSSAASFHFNFPVFRSESGERALPERLPPLSIDSRTSGYKTRGEGLHSRIARGPVRSPGW